MLYFTSLQVDSCTVTDEDKDITRDGQCQRFAGALYIVAMSRLPNELVTIVQKLV